MAHATIWMTMVGALLFFQDCGPGGGDDDTPGDDDDSSTPGACPLSADARSLLEETVDELLRDTHHVATYSDASDRGFSLQLVGVDQSYVGFMSLAFACTEPVLYDPYCEGSVTAVDEPIDPFWTTRNRGSRLGCETADVGLVDVYFAMKPHTDPEDRHVFTYDTESPAAAATFDPNPFVRYRIDLTDPQKVAVTSEIERLVDIVTEPGEEIDLTHTGTVAITRSGELTSGTLALQFPVLASGTAPVEVAVVLLASGGTSGTVAAGDQQLASISGHDVKFTWAEGCAP